MAQIEDVVAELRLQTAKFNADMRAAEQQMSRSTAAMSGHVKTLDDRFQRLSSTMGTAFAAVGAIAAAGLTSMLTAVVNVGDELNRASIQTGISAEQLSVLRVAAEQADTSLSAVAVAIRNMNRAFVEAQQQEGDARDQLHALGLSLADIGHLSQDPLRAFLEISKRLEAVKNQATQTTIAQGLLGRSFLELRPLIKDLNEQGFAELERQTKALNQLWTTDAAQAADAFNDHLTRMKLGLQGLARFLVESIIPSFNAFFDMVGVETRRGAERMAAEEQRLIEQRKDTQRRLTELQESRGVLGFLGGGQGEIDRLTQQLEGLNTQIDATHRAAVAMAQQELRPVTPDVPGTLPDKDARARATKAATEAEREARRELEQFVRDSNSRMEADDKDRADALTAAMESAEAPIDTFRRQLEELQRLQPFLPVDTFSKAVGALSEEFSRADPTIQAWLRDLERAGAILQANETPLDSYNRALEELTRLHEAGALSAAQFERVLGNLDAGLYEQLQALNETNDAVRDFGLVFTSAFEDAAVAGADFNEVLGGLVEDLHRLALRLIVTEPLLKALEQAFKDLKATDITTFFAKVASWLGALIPGYAAPASGTQVDTAPSVPPVPVAAATNPAFASSMAAAGATSMTGAVTVNVINNANNTTVSQQQTTGPNGSVQLDVMIDEMMAGQAASPNNAYARTMRGTYGLQPQLIGR